MNRNLLKNSYSFYTRVFILGMLNGFILIWLYFGFNRNSLNLTQHHFSAANTLTKVTPYKVYLENGHQDLTHEVKKHFHVTSHQELSGVFSDSGFQLPEHKSLVKAYNDMYVPRLYLVALPKDFKEASLSSKKRLFLKSLLPIVLRVNEDIIKDRRQLLRLINKRTKTNGLESYEHRWLYELKQKYRLKKLDLQELKRRVDIIPPSLALGQAIVESGWGTSHSALQHNSTFGLRNHDDSHSLVYDSLTESVENYMRNINAHLAYSKLRQLRQQMRETGQKLCSLKLAHGLLLYSTRGRSYVEEISDLIRLHDLKKYDDVRLTITSDES